MLRCDIIAALTCDVALIIGAQRLIMKATSQVEHFVGRSRYRGENNVSLPSARTVFDLGLRPITPPQNFNPEQLENIIT